MSTHITIPTPAGPRALGRNFALDHRDADFLLKDVVPAQPAVKRKKTYRLDARLDQGPFPKCVEYGWRHRILAEPYRSGKMEKAAGQTSFYDLFQANDEWPGPPPPYDGTSVRAGAKVLQEQGYIKVYRWAFSVLEAMDAFFSLGPLVAGTNWYEHMSVPIWSEKYQRFILRAGEAGGEMQGGHCYLIVGGDDHTGMACVHNSWGREWGQNGRAWITYEDLEGLIRDAGEMCCPTER